MQPHQQRVVDEKKELDEKLTKLNLFIAESPTFTGLPDDEKSRLIAQKAHMEGYSDILGERIAAFPAA
jgi:hypothetical protein